MVSDGSDVRCVQWVRWVGWVGQMGRMHGTNASSVPLAIFKKHSLKQSNFLIKRVVRQKSGNVNVIGCVGAFVCIHP